MRGNIMTSGIYMIKNKKTGQMYIGQSINIERRFDEHIRGINIETQYIDSAIRKHGKNSFNYDIIEKLPNNKKILNERERYWIDYYNTFSDKKHYNLLIGGNGLGSGKFHPCFKGYYRVRTKGNNSINNKNYALVNSFGKEIKYSVDKKFLENLANKLNNGEIKEKDLFLKKYKVVKHGFYKDTQRYALISPEGEIIEHSIYKQKLINKMYKLNTKKDING